MARSPLIPACLLALLLATPAAAEVYKWVDEQGVTHYSQQPPPGAEAQVIDPNIARPSDAGSGEGGSGSAGDGTGEGGKGEDSQSLADFCKQLREQAQLLASGRPVKVKQSDDTVATLEGDARQQRLKELQSQIQQHCQGGS